MLSSYTFAEITWLPLVRTPAPRPPVGDRSGCCNARPGRAWLLMSDSLPAYTHTRTHPTHNTHTHTLSSPPLVSFHSCPFLFLVDCFFSVFFTKASYHNHLPRGLAPLLLVAWQAVRPEHAIRHPLELRADKLLPEHEMRQECHISFKPSLCNYIEPTIRC